MRDTSLTARGALAGPTTTDQPGRRRRIGRRRPRHGLPPMLSFDLRAVSVAEGARAGLAVAAVVALHQWLRWPGLMETALAALLTCLCDAGGPIHRRLPALLAFGLIGASLTGVFAALHGVWPLLAVPLGGMVVFLAAFARAFGPSSMQVGNLLAVVLILAFRQHGPGPEAAATSAVAFLAGALWATLLTMLIWRLHPYRPSRQAVATALHALAVLAADMRDAAEARDETTEARWDRHARLHRRVVRDALEQARIAVLQTVRVRGPAAGVAAQSWLRLEAADQLFGALIAVSDLLSGPDAGTLRRRADRMLRLVVAVLGALEREVTRDTPRLRPGLERAIAAIVPVAGTDGAQTSAGADGAQTSTPATAASALHLVHLAQVISQRLRAALSPAQGPGRMPITPAPRWRDVIVANLRITSDILRHALRAGTTACLGLLVVTVWPAPYLHWFAITLLMTLQPYVALTLVRAIERIGGTVLGGVLAAVIALYVTTPVAIAAVLFPLSVIALTVRSVSFGLFMAALTPVVVLLSEIGAPEESQLTIALLRALFSCLGGLLALAACVVLWPSWEPQRLRAQMQEALRTHGRYAAAAIGEVLQETDGASVEAARRAAGTASNAFEASLQRVLLERGLTLGAARSFHPGLPAMLTVDAALRRLAGRLTTLHLTPRRLSPDAPAAAWRALRDWLLSATEALANGATDIPPRPATDTEALARLARPIELASGALRRPA